ncbi:MAG: hypothetical protein WEB87_04425 [Bacteriovoracaceae bacterium]
MKDSAEENIDYHLPNLSKPRWTLYIFGFFVLSFLMYFPIAAQIESTIKKSLTSIPGCSIGYKDLDFQWLMPKFVVKDLSVPASCFNQRGSPILFKETFLYIRGLSFIPFGPHFKLETTALNSPLKAYITAGFGSLAFNLKDSELDLKSLSPLLPGGVKLDGKANVDALIKTGSQGIEDFNLRIVSKDLSLPAQSVQAFAFSRMPINNLLLKAQMEDKNVLNVSEFILGDVESPVRANFSGKVELNQRVPAASRLDLVGEVAFSQSFLDQYSIIGMVMNQFDKKDDFYQIQLQGTLASPAPSSPRK